jgi:hypothetical protein
MMTGIGVARFWERMRGAMAMRHPLLATFLGDVELDTVVRSYIAVHPPSPLGQAKVGARLAEFLGSNEPWSAHPIIAELAAYDYRRSGVALQPEEKLLTRAQLSAVHPHTIARTRIRLKKRSALVTTRFRFHALPPTRLSRATPLDEQPTYLLVHMARNDVMTIEVDACAHAAFEHFALGGTMRVLTQALRGLTFTELEIERFLARCFAAGLLVADGHA